MYKILLVKNRYTKSIDLKKYLDWFKTNTPIETVIVDTISTDFDLTSMPVGQTGASGVVPGMDVLPKLRSVVPQGKYHAVVLVAGNKMDGVRVSIAYNEPLFPGTHLIYLCFLSDQGKSLNHELFHTFFQRLRLQGVQIDDPIDMVFYEGKWRPYFNNSLPNAKPSNRSIALERLTPYWNQITNLTTTPMTYKYFSQAEVAKWKLKPEMWRLLDKIREEFGSPINITSGLRTQGENNALKDSVSNSAHLSGLAADISCLYSDKRFKLVEVALKNGVNRIGIGKTFVHLDIDPTKPKNVLWHYY